MEQKMLAYIYPILRLLKKAIFVEDFESPDWDE
jgi:hypothetical protein